MYVIKVKDKNLFASAHLNEKTGGYLDLLDKAQIYYSDNGIKIRFNIEEKKYGKGSCEIRKVEIKLK